MLKPNSCALQYWSFSQSNLLPACVKKGSIARFRGCRSGVAALEFALVAPVMLLMILGMLCLGLYLTYVHELEELASSAARASVAGLSEAERDMLARQFVTNATTNQSFIAASDLTVTTATSGTPAVNYAVTISYSLQHTPIPTLAQLASIQTSAITRTSTIQFGSY